MAEDTVVERLAGDRIRVSTNGREFVVDGICTHRGGRLAHGRVNAQRQRITCPLHHSTFDLATGCLLAGPADRPLGIPETEEGPR